MGTTRSTGATLATWLQAGGYRTAHFGKTLNAYSRGAPPPPGWDEWATLTGTPQQRSYNYTLNVNGVLKTYGNKPADHLTDVLAGMSERFIDEAPLATPFYLQVPVLAPHIEDTGPPRAAPRHVGMFAAEPFPMGPSFNEADVTDKPGITAGLPVMTPAVVALLAKQYRARLESLQTVDDLVERVVNSLAAKGVLDETLILFTSDNGYLMGQHRVAGDKNVVYEESVRVPLLVRGPGFAAGAHVSALTSNIDLAPTIVATTAVTPGRLMDGVALGDPIDHRALLLHTGPSGVTNNIWFEAVRTDRYVYVEYTSGHTELYDLDVDPFQLASVHNSARYAALRNDLASLLESMRGCQGAQCTKTWQPASPPLPTPPISISDAIAFEGNSGTRNLAFVVSIPYPEDTDLTFKVATADATAHADEDYVKVGPKTVTLRKGSTSVTVFVPVKGDRVLEQDEVFSVVLSEPSNGALGSASAVGTIEDDDSVPVLTLSDVSLLEGRPGTRKVKMVVQFSHPAPAAGSFVWHTVDGSATAPVDYVATTAAKVSFGVGTTSRSLLVAVKGDNVGEADESFRVVLSALVGATINDPDAVVTLVNDD